MVVRQDIARRLAFLKNGEALVGLLFLLAGLFVAREGFLRLKALWVLFAPNFPLSMQDYTGQRILGALPFLSGAFISIVGSICAILIGILWAGTGVGEAFRSWRKTPPPSVFKDPDMVAESLRVSRAQHRQSHYIGMLAALWPRARLVSPIAYELMGLLLGYCCKLVFAGVLIAVVSYVLYAAPLLISRYLHVNVSLLAPSAKPLYFLLGFMIFVYLLIGLSLIAFRRQEFARTAETFAIVGRGDSHLFFALLEEGCRLLTAKPFPHRIAVRLQLEANPRIRGTLIENYPESVRYWARPAAYVCLPVFFLLLTAGFTRLINFRLITDAIPHLEFLRAYLLDYLLEVAFALGLIIVGLQLADVTRRLFGVRTFRSTAVFCYVGQTLPNPPTGGRDSRRRSDQQTKTEWKVVEGVDEQFARWAKDTNTETKFRVNIYWAEVFSESISAAAPRLLTGMHKSQSVEAAMERILKIPLTADFDIEMPAPGAGKEETGFEASKDL
ncbi:MAG: hypothetical protein ACLQPD_09810 [Desulfomonilaceae bacterium]